MKDMLSIDHTILAVVDIQGKLAQAMYKKDDLIENLQKLIRGIRVLEIPVIWLEQNPEGLGPTVPEVVDLLTDLEPIRKFCFSCCDSEHFVQEIKLSKRDQILLAGIEAHVCIYQTARDLVGLGYEVQVVMDAVSSRTHENKLVGVQKIREAGASITSTETALFELLRVADGPKFKEILRIVK